MNAQTDPMLRFEAASDRAAAEIGWKLAAPLTAAATVILLAIYWQTAKSMVATWSGSATFAHGYVIVPIALVLAWRKRRELARLVPAADYAGLLFLAGAGLAWLVAAAGQVQVVQQYAVTAMIPALVLALAGRDVARALAFPLAFLLLAVPVGDAFIPRLMDWTADFTVAALRLTGIPVYREGTFFSIPTGNWSVVEACSGLRYLIASVTVGVLYAYLNYQRLWKRLFFVGLSALVPLAANGVRAYLIVMIGHLSGMKLAVGIDHLIYGWIFFGVVMLLLFWLGSFWRDPVRRADEEVVPLHTAPSSSAALAASAVAALAIAAAWPLYAAHLERANGAIGAPVLARPAGAAGWSSETLPLTDWRPRYSGAAASSFELYRKGDRAVALYVGYYRGQRKGAELVTSGNVIVAQGDPLWMNVGDSARTEDLGNGPVDMRETRLRSARQRLLVWDWYRVAGSDLSNPYVAKLLLARDKLLYRGDDAAVIMLATPYEIRTQAAEEALREFARAMLPSINAALEGAASGEPAPMHVAH